MAKTEKGYGNAVYGMWVYWQ